jgi:ankyrin repeat protein
MSDKKTLSWAVASLLISMLFILSPIVYSAELAATSSKDYKILSPYYYAAARTGDIEVVSKFLAAGFPVNVKDEKGYTALMIATYHGRTEMVNQLLSVGANVCAQDNRGNTALMAAIFRGEFRIAKRLLSFDCDAAQLNNAGQSARDFSVVFGREEIEALLNTKELKLD